MVARQGHVTDMSKAFTSEHDTPQPLLGVMPTARRPITAAGMAKFQLELRQLLNTTRPALLAASARGEGDAQAQLQTVEWRIKMLTRQLELSDVVRIPDGVPKTVGLGTRVRVRDEDGSEHSYTIVGPDEIDAKTRCVSHASPVGQALLGLAPGAWATIRRPAGPREVEIIALEAV